MKSESYSVVAVSDKLLHPGIGFVSCCCWFPCMKRKLGQVRATTPADKRMWLLHNFREMQSPRAQEIGQWGEPRCIYSPFAGSFVSAYSRCNLKCLMSHTRWLCPFILSFCTGEIQPCGGQNALDV